MARERSYRLEAVVLRRSDFGEADRLLTLYSREQGKVRAVAKGARKPQSRKTGHVELYMRTQFQVATGRTLPIVTQAELIDAYQPLRDDLVRMTYAAYVVELLDRFAPDEEPNRELFDLLTAALGWFAVTDNYLLAARYYELRLLSLVGFQPQLFRCVASAEPIEQEDQFFSAELGGLIRPNRRAADRHAIPISAAAVKVLRFLQTRAWETVQPLQLRRALHRELEAVMLHYLTHLLERRLHAADFLFRLRREAALLLGEDDAAAEPDENDGEDSAEAPASAA